MNVNIDWIVAIGIFLILLGWSFSYYWDFFSERSSPLKNTLDIVSNRIFDYLLIDSYTIPVKVNSPGSASGSILYFDLTWPANTMNSTKVYAGSTPLSCNITNDILYWQSDLSAGDNHFLIKFSNNNVSLNCNSTFSIYGNTSQVTPWTQEKKIQLSQTKVDQMTNMGYAVFRTLLGINRTFRVELVVNDTTTATVFGSNLSVTSSTFVKERNSRIEENGNRATLRALVW